MPTPQVSFFFDIACEGLCVIFWEYMFLRSVVMLKREEGGSKPSLPDEEKSGYQMVLSLRARTAIVPHRTAARETRKKTTFFCARHARLLTEFCAFFRVRPINNPRPSLVGGRSIQR